MDLTFGVHRASESRVASLYVNIDAPNEGALMYPTLSDRLVLEWVDDAKAWAVVDTWEDGTYYYEIGDYDLMKTQCRALNETHLR
jgi:hypothetical protein